MWSVAARRSVTPRANVRPAAPPCPRSQPTRKCGELPSVRMGRSMNLVHFETSQNTSGGRISRAVKHLNDRTQAEFFCLPWNAAPWKVPPGAHAPLPLRPPPSRRNWESYCWSVRRAWNVDCYREDDHSEFWRAVWEKMDVNKGLCN